VPVGNLPVATTSPAAVGEPTATVLVVVPTYNEKENVSCLAQRILEVLPSADILFIDDNSPDGTGRAVETIRRGSARVRLLTRPRKLGLGTAYLAGFDLGCREGYDFVVTMDADLSHDPAHLPEMLDAAATHDVVIGSRYIPGGGIRHWGLHRRLLSRVANLYAVLLLGLPVKDCTSGFRVYRTALLRELPLSTIKSSGYSFLEEMNYLAHRHQSRMTEVPIIFLDRRGGRSKISPAEIFFAVYHVLRLRLRSSR